MKKQIIILATLVLSIMGCQKSFFTGDINTLDKGLIEKEVIKNPISVAAARKMYETMLSEIPIPESDSINPHDLLPNWNEAGDFNFIDTSDSYLSVPTGKFVGGGYKKLLFMRQNGQLTYFVAYIRADVDYISRKNGICDMNDFCGYVFYKNKEGAYFLGFKLKEGQIVEVLTPNNAPRPENQDENDVDGGILNTFTVTATAPSSYSPIFSNFTFGFGTNNLAGGININSLLGGNSSTSGGGNGSLNGGAGPVLDSTTKVCPLSFDPRVVSRLSPDGSRTITDVARLTAGLKDVPIRFTYEDRAGRILTSQIIIPYLFITMPNNCGESFGKMASEAIKTAVSTTQTALSGGRAVGTTSTSGTFLEELHKALNKQDENNCAGFASPTRSSAELLSSITAIEDYFNNYNTTFTDFTTCK